MKALLKKQFLQLTSFLFISKSGKSRKTIAIVGMLLLAVYAVGAVGATFWLLADAICEALVAADLAWVYFAFMGVLATGFCCLGSVFVTKSHLYEAKDNDLLLSMPIKPWKIVFVRMLDLYVAAFFFVALVFIPSIIAYLLVAKTTFIQVLFLILLTLIMPLGALAICCLLGWLIALATSKMRSKNLVTTLLLVAFSVGYVFLYTKLNDALEYVLTNGAAVGNTIERTLYPFWQLGLAATGEALPMLVFTAIFGGAFALAYYIVNKTFIRVVTVKRGGKKGVYKERSVKPLSCFPSLMKRETMRYFKNPMVTINCLLGSLFFLVLIVLALCNPTVCEQLSLLQNRGLLFTCVLCFVATMNMLTSSSVSLEGENLWIVRSLPVDTFTVLLSKLALHMLVTGIPALLCAVVVGIALRLSVWWILLAAATALVFVAFTALSGLAINLKLPNLHWNSEVVAVKQSMASLIAIFAGWGAAAVLPIAYFTIGEYLPTWALTSLCAALTLAADVLLLLWTEKKGTKIFRGL